MTKVKVLPLKWVDSVRLCLLQELASCSWKSLLLFGLLLLLVVGQLLVALGITAAPLDQRHSNATSHSAGGGIPHLLQDLVHQFFGGMCRKADRRLTGLSLAM